MDTDAQHITCGKNFGNTQLIDFGLTQLIDALWSIKNFETSHYYENVVHP